MPRRSPRRRAATPAASNLTRPLLQPSDLRVPRRVQTAAVAPAASRRRFATGGLAVRRVAATCNSWPSRARQQVPPSTSATSPAGALDESTWPQSTVVHEWGMAVYGSPSVTQTRTIGRPA